MKIVDAAKIIDIARIISLTVMLAYMVLLFIRFLNSYLSACVLYLTVRRQTIFNCPYARKRVVNRIAHDRKFALFQRYGEKEAYQDMIYNATCLIHHKNGHQIRQPFWSCHHLINGRVSIRKYGALLLST